MANSVDVLNHILDRPPSSPIPVAYNFLVPNLKGLENYLRATEKLPRSPPEPTFKQVSESYKSSPTPPPSPKPGHAAAAHITSSVGPYRLPSDETTIKGPENVANKPDATCFTEISVFTAASEAFSKANTNCSIAESLERCKPIISLAKSRNIRVRGYVSVALGCPYEGPNIPPAKVAEITTTLLEFGVDEVSVADTTGMGTAPRTQELLRVLSSSGISHKDLALHFHDTYGQALVNTMVGMEHGIRTFDCSVGGLGGCPYAKGATGNVATEDLVYCLHSLGAKTGIDLEKMAEIGAWICAELGRPNDSRAGKAIASRKPIESSPVV
jgi:hydroxymethylglutaryl-CoA lyase